MVHKEKDFLWTPGRGIDMSALDRLRTHFRRPPAPMGEAWLMDDERKMYPELMGDLGELAVSDLKEPLIEIAGGTSSFGPLEEWTTWYHYLLAALLPRSHEAYVSYLLEPLVTAFMAIYPEGIVCEPYAGFHEDALCTLGRCIMDSECWSGTDIVIGKALRRANNHPHRVWVWWDVSGDLSASLFFCMKYLPESAVETWLRSVLAIPSPQWRGQLMAWFVGAHGFLTGAVRWPSELPTVTHPDVGWEWSHTLRPGLVPNRGNGSPTTPEFLPKASREAALKVLRSYFTEDRFLEWLECISTVPDLHPELCDIPSTFEALYVESHLRGAFRLPKVGDLPTG